MFVFIIFDRLKTINFKDIMDNIKDVENLDKLKNKFDNEISKIIVGQKEIIDQIFIALLSNGHIILEGVPGLAKTLLINSIAKALNLDFSRIQFTPDLMPTDITGTEIIQENKSTGEREFQFYKGPIFSNIILADEINRTPPKTQAALLQAMQEKKVTIGNQTYNLNKPFFVFATQNPIEQEGTYPLPEAQVDRFMFKLIVNYPKQESERLILRKNAKKVQLSEFSPIVSSNDILNAQGVITDIYVDEKVEDYVLNLIFATRNPKKYKLEDLEGIIDFGASPRATINLIRAAKARAFTEHRGYITPEDIRYIGTDILRHRIILTYEAEAEELTSDDIINRLFEVVEIP